MGPSGKPVLYVIVCAAPPAQTMHERIGALQAQGWDVCVITTPHASGWVDRDKLEQITGYPVRTEYKLPGEPDALPKADAMMLIPATFNTVNKWANGIGDTLAVSLLCEALGNGTVPLVVVPCVKMDLVRHPAFAKSVALLRECGVHVLHEPERYKAPLMVPWEEVLEVLGKLREVCERV